MAMAANPRRALKAPWQVWRDAAGRLSALRIGALAFLFVPVVIAVYDFNTVGFGARRVNDVIHRTGYWALIFLMSALAAAAPGDLRPRIARAHSFLSANQGRRLAADLRGRPVRLDARLSAAGQMAQHAR